MKINLKNVRVTSYTVNGDAGSAGPPKSLKAVAARGAFKRGERIPKLHLQDSKGETVAVELAHVVQQRAGVGRTAKGEAVEEVTISFHAIKRDH